MPPSATKSTFQIGTWNPLTDAFTQVLDLNDGTTFQIHNKALKLPQPDKTIILAGNVRTPGSVVPRWQYKERHIQVEVSLRGANTTAMLASIRALLSAIEQPPYAIRLALPGSNQYSYADVYAVKHDIPSDTQQILAGAITRIHMDFTCAVGLRGDRITLQNLVANPGFEAPSGPLVSVFNDSFANANAYSVLFGGAPSVAANVMTLAATSALSFGSPAWGAIGQWLIRWRWQTSLSAYFYVHFVDGNNWLGVQCEGATLQFIQSIGGVQHQLANVGAALTNGTFYWISLTQFPSVTGSPPAVAATLYNDSGGSLGTQVAGTGVVQAFDAVTALSGRMAIQANNTTMQVGGAFSNVHLVSLFGPGGWTCFPSGAGGPSSTGVCSGAWDGSVAGAPTSTNANTYPNGPVSSFGAARLDLPPAGTVSASWTNYSGGAPAGTPAIPVHAAGDTLSAVLWVKSSGLSANATIFFIANEYNASGSFLRFTTLQSRGGNQGSWITFSGSWATGANCAYVGLGLRVDDSAVAGESANATVWIENVQCWNQTTTGMSSSMPYCELRFRQSPAQLLVSGLAGDMPAAAFLALGTYQATWAAGTTITYALGSRAVVSTNARLVAADTADSTIPLVLDSSSYGGFYVSGTNGYEDTPFSLHPGDIQGVFHAFSRYRSGQSGGALASVTTFVEAWQQAAPFYSPNASDYLWQYIGPSTAPLTAGSVWTVADAGQVSVPLASAGALRDLTQGYVSIGAVWQDNNPPQASRINWQCLLPIDGALLYGTLINPATSGISPTNAYVWMYLDGLLVEQGSVSASTSYSTETIPLPNAAHAAVGPGTAASNYPSVNTAADPYLTLNPALDAGSAAAQIGVNQMAAFLTDNNGTVLPLFAEISYSPLYLYPR